MNEKILVVDDSDLSLRQMERFLRDTGYSVEFAGSVSSALEKIKTTHYDIVITDKNMPGLHSNTDEGGLELLKEIQKLHPETETIMMTGFATIETAIEAMRLGAFDYLIKPFTMEELLDCIKRLLGYRAFINPKNIITIYKGIHNEILNLMERQGAVNDEEGHMILKSIDEKIDIFFRNQKNWERIMLQQRDALAGIIPLAEELSGSLEKNDPRHEIVKKILEAAETRI
jgi:CheY-like chemotaxis protein